VASRRRGMLERATRPLIDRLEGRRLLSVASIAIISGAAGSGSLDGFLSATDGTITTADAPSGGTVSKGALEGVNSTTDINITSPGGIEISDVGGGTISLNTGSANVVVYTAHGGSSLVFDNVADTLSATNASSMSLQADDMTLGHVTVGTHALNLAPITSGRQ